MDCPRTGKSMNEVDIAGVKVDISTGCGGVWFDNFELEKFDETHESAGDQLISQSKQFEADVDTSQKLKCPKGCDAVLMRHNFSVKRAVEIDECPACAGIWLDSGELKAIRELFVNEEAKNEAADAYFEELFNSPEINAMKEKSEEDAKKAKRLAHVFRFICPTYYIPGKQDWGAF